MEFIRFVHKIFFSGLCPYSMQPLPASTVTTETIPYGKLCMTHKQLHSSQSTLALIETRQANRYSCSQLMCKSARPGIYIESLVNRRKDKAGCRILSIHTLSLISSLIQCHSVSTFWAPRLKNLGPTHKTRGICPQVPGKVEQPC